MNKNIVNVYGRGSAFNSIYANTFGVINNKDRNSVLLFDCGSTTFSKLNEINFDFNQNIVVAITHMHTDHIGSLGTLIEYMYYVKKKPVEIVIAHELESRLISYLKLSGINIGMYKCSSHFSNEVNTKGFAVKLIEVPHVKEMKSFALDVRVDSKKVLWSGDISDYSVLITHIEDNPEFDEIYCDFSLKGSTVHEHGESKLLELISCTNAKVELIHYDDMAENYERLLTKIKEDKI